MFKKVIKNILNASMEVGLSVIGLCFFYEVTRLAYFVWEQKLMNYNTSLLTVFFLSVGFSLLIYNLLSRDIKNEKNELFKNDSPKERIVKYD